VAYNKKHNIVPQTVSREVGKSIGILARRLQKESSKKVQKLSERQKLTRVVELEAAMHEAAEKLDFETAIKLRQEWQELRSSL